MSKEEEEALSKIRAAADAGEIDFASDTLTAQYDEEIQVIFRELYRAKNGRDPKRDIWTADGQNIGVLLDWDPVAREYTPESHAISRAVGAKLGIQLSPRSIWEHAAAELRSRKEGTVKS